MLPKQRILKPTGQPIGEPVIVQVLHEPHKAKDTKGQDVHVNVEALTERSSKLSIRVGVFGDEAVSQMILNAIQKRL